MVDFATKKQHYIKEINKIAKESFNDEQKELVRGILDSATEANIDSLYTFVTQRVKTGFVFDAAPEVAHNCISLCERNNKKSFGNESGTHHKLIIGENYDVLKNLVATYTKNGKGLIDVIYIDPPYNTEKTHEDGNDYKTEIKSEKFVYRDKFSRVGWLNMMKERLELARKLLSNQGVIFISIDDNEQAYLKVLCDEIFGENNFVACFVWRKKYGGGKGAKLYVDTHEYILCFAKNIASLSFYPLKRTEKQSDVFQLKDKYLEERGKYYIRPLKSGLDERKTLVYPIECPDGTTITTQWICAQDTFKQLLAEDRIVFKLLKDGKYNVYKKFYENDLDGVLQESIIYDLAYNADAKIELKKIFNIVEGRDTVFPNPKPTKLIKRILTLSASKNSIVLDFFGGSGTTMQAVMELNVEDGGKRQCILVTNNENDIATNVTYERIYRVVNGKGTKKETFDWIYRDDKPYLTDNYIDVFNTNSYELQIDDYDKAQILLDKAKVEFKKLNPDYEFHDLDIYNHLASLKPYKKN